MTHGSLQSAVAAGNVSSVDEVHFNDLYRLEVIQSQSNVERLNSANELRRKDEIEVTLLYSHYK
jgi:hypothetical protein